MVDAPKDQRSRRSHGFERPWHPFQMATWVLYPLVLVHYYAFLHFLLWNLTVQIVMLVLFTIISVTMGVSVYLTSITDPADASLHACAAADGTAAQVHDTGDSQFCYLCEVEVHSSSRHCRFCNKCVTRFDHHCKWLNTCIGQSNYRYFLLIVFSTAALTTQSLALSIALTIDSFIASDSFLDRINLQRDIGSNLPIEAIQALLLFSVLCLAPLVLMVYQLLGFHIMLLTKGITTYDYIILEQRKNREREAERLQAQYARQQKQSKKQQARLQSQTALANAGKTSAGAGTDVEMARTGAVADAGAGAGGDSQQQQQQQQTASYEQLNTAEQPERGEGKGESCSDREAGVDLERQPLGTDGAAEHHAENEHHELIHAGNEDEQLEF